MDRHEREPQAAEQEIYSVPEEDIAFQFLLQAPSIDQAQKPRAFTDKSPKHNELVYIAAGKASTLERREDWKDSQINNFDDRKLSWKNDVVQFFKENHDYFASPEGQTASEFYNRLSDASGFKIDPLLPTLDMAESLFNQYSAKDNDRTSLSSKFVEDVLKAEELLEEGSTRANKIQRYHDNRDIIWRTAHIFGKHSADIALHLLDSEVSIKSGYDFAPFMGKDKAELIASEDDKKNNLLKRLVEGWPQVENDRKSVVDVVGQDKPEVLIDKSQVDLAGKWDILKQHYPDLPDIVTPFSDEWNEPIQYLYDLLEQAESTRYFPAGDAGHQWVVDAIRNLGYEFEIDVVSDMSDGEKKLTKIKNISRPEPVVSEKNPPSVPAPTVRSLKGVPPSLPVSPKGGEIIVGGNGDVSVQEKQGSGISNPVTADIQLPDTIDSNSEFAENVKTFVRSVMDEKLDLTEMPSYDQDDKAVQLIMQLLKKNGYVIRTVPTVGGQEKVVEVIKPESAARDTITTNPPPAPEPESRTFIENEQSVLISQQSEVPDLGTTKNTNNARRRSNGSVVFGLDKDPEKIADEIFSRLENGRLRKGKEEDEAGKHANLYMHETVLDEEVMEKIGIILDRIAKTKSTSVTQVFINRKHRSREMFGMRGIEVEFVARKNTRRASPSPDAINFDQSEDPSTKVDEIFSRLAQKDPVVVEMFIPAIQLNPDITGIIGVILKKLGKKGLSTKGLEIEKIYNEAVRTDAVIVKFVNEDPEETSFPREHAVK